MGTSVDFMCQGKPCQEKLKALEKDSRFRNINSLVVPENKKDLCAHCR